jgi:hypothetical membrane protein
MTTHTHSVELGARPQPVERAAILDARRGAGIVLFVLAAEFMTAIMLAASMAPGYDIGGGAISDLGVTSETAWLFNASLVFIGALNIVGGFLLYRSHGRAWILGTFVLAGLGAIGAGLFPLDRGDAHSLFALAAFVFFNVEAIACAMVVTGPMRIISALAGTIGLGFVVLMVIGDAGNPGVFGAMGHGGAERMIVYPVMMWLMAFGGYLLATPNAGEDAR